MLTFIVYTVWYILQHYCILKIKFDVFVHVSACTSVYVCLTQAYVGSRDAQILKAFINFNSHFIGIKSLHINVLQQFHSATGIKWLPTCLDYLIHQILTFPSFLNKV